MKQYRRYRNAVVAIGLIICSGVVFTQCISRQNDAKASAQKISFQQFAGSASCASCHQAIYHTHVHTGHYNTSMPATESAIKGSFETGKNSYSYSLQLRVAMEKRDSGLYQVAYLDGTEKLARRFDIVMGSGTKGQTFAYWHNNQLFQLPITYFTAAGEWSNSPGYPQKAVFNRPITSRCMECHSTYASTISATDRQPEEFDRTNIIYGVDCERCHGPGAAHAAYQQQHPQEKKAKFIVNPALLGRQQQLDACALCHGGKLQKTTPSFQFVAGDRLADFFTYDTTTPNPDNIDLHGNQYGLLRASKCFRRSETMTCNTCHNPHENERGKVELFSERCLNCHNTTQHGNGIICKMTDTLGDAIVANCIDCHMPSKPSHAIALYLPGANEPTAAHIRAHFISIYRNETTKFMNGRAEKKKG